jgi:hypothetical protein
MDAERTHGLISMAICAGRESGPVRLWLDDTRGRIVDAARRGATEAAVPFGGSAAEWDAVRRALAAGGFAVTAVAGEDGCYSVVHW